MNVIIKNIDKDNIVINKKNNIFKLYYNLNLYYKIIGIPLKINYKYITIRNNLYYISILGFDCFKENFSFLLSFYELLGLGSIPLQSPFFRHLQQCWLG